MVDLAGATARRRPTPAMVIAILWAAALFFPAIQAGNYTITSLFFLLWGRSGLMILDIDWLANPLVLCVTLLLLGHVQRPRTMTALGVALFVLLVKSAARATMIVNENQNSVAIDHHLAGWYLWIAAQIVALAAICVAVAEPRAMGLALRTRKNP
ncbi:MAG: hypothetical protein JWL96_588 [Sphingomonas bacterium]|nr:hypothetical protein [Sphingomonas bacterium]